MDCQYARKPKNWRKEERLEISLPYYLYFSITTPELKSVDKYDFAIKISGKKKKIPNLLMKKNEVPQKRLSRTFFFFSPHEGVVDKTISDGSVDLISVHKFNFFIFYFFLLIPRDSILHPLPVPHPSIILL